MCKGPGFHPQHHESKKELDMWHACSPGYLGGAGRIPSAQEFGASLGNRARPCFKKMKQNKNKIKKVKKHETMRKVSWKGRFNYKYYF
jgi:hypothetical protein